jgi:hypothetical protein
MQKTPKLKPDNPEQFKRFIEMAREVEVDESPDALDRALKKIVHQPERKSGRTKKPA